MEEQHQEVMASAGTCKRRQDGDAEGATALPAKTPKQSKKNPHIVLDELKQEWAPERVNRMDSGILKPSNKASRRLCGGDWISASDGTSATLSFVFHCAGKYYGLTSAHTFDEAPDGDVYAFTKLGEISPGGKEEGEFDPETDSNSFAAYKIGKIVSRSDCTDSVVFEFDDNIEVKPPLTVKVSSVSTKVIRLPDVKSVVSPPTQGSTLVGFGASCRGFHAVVETPSTNETHKLASVPDGSIGICNQEDGERITFQGDCGTIFMDLECNGVYFHTDGTEAAPWKSFGAPLVKVMSKHPLLGGTSESEATTMPDGNELSSYHKENDHRVQDGHAKESIVPIPGKKFNLHIVPPPLRTTTRAPFKVRNFKIIPAPVAHKEEKMMEK